MTHAWWHDIARDAVVRGAAEDGRDRPLPTLGECIAMIPKSGSASSAVEHENKGESMATKRDEQAADYRAEAIARPFAEAAERSVPVSKTGEGQSGMRTERVTLEITSAHDERLADCIVESIGDSLLHGESVRVVEEAHFDDLAQVAMERDAAIRERDALRAERITQALTADRFAAAVSEADTLQARVAELEAAAKLAPHANAGGEANHAAQAASGRGGEGGGR